jgi:serine/threonine protein kinase
MRPEAMRYPNSDEGRKITQLFQREAAAIARLNHPNILPLYKFGVTAMDAYPLMYMVMPYCQEKSLYDWMYARGKIILSPQEVDHVLRQIVEALQLGIEGPGLSHRKLHFRDDLDPKTLACYGKFVPACMSKSRCGCAF